MWWTKRNRTPIRKNEGARRRLKVERLSGRYLLAADIAAPLSTSTSRTGLTAVTSVSVDQEQSSIQIQGAVTEDVESGWGQPGTN